MTMLGLFFLVFFGLWKTKNSILQQIVCEMDPTCICLRFELMTY